LLQKEFKKQGDFLFRYRSYLPLIILVAGLAVFMVSNIRSVSQGHEFSEGYYMYICLAVSITGQLVRIITVGHTPANTSGRNREEQVADVINVTGIYSVVRHPLYLGNFLMWLGLAMLTRDFWFIVSFILLFWVYYERIMYAEEVFLLDKFGRSYERWAESTPAFIPAFKNYEKSGLPFSWKKILKNEKNGIGGIFVIFFVFDFTGHAINAGEPVIVTNFWFYAAIASLIFYFIFKYLKRKTSILDEEGR
jgi:protein-S-isoprenylcysteine O-methyltransferase Ste14